ncbi:MAG: DUF4118 domain-containing protein [Lachnospiraceae bacterium]|nr:DUF4118 domain-containing protein [Lachnospiraceae bacterium]
MDRIKADKPGFTIKRNSRLFNNLYCLSAVIVITFSTTGITLIFNELGLDKENLLMLFLVGVLLVTVATSGYWFGSLAAVMSVFLFNFFFTEPLYTFAISDQQDILLLFFFLIAALISGLMSSKLKSQREIAQRNAEVTGQLYEITESFLKLTGVENIIHNALSYIWQNTGNPCKIELTEQIVRDFSGELKLHETYSYPEAGEAEFKHCLPIMGINQQIGMAYFQVNGSFEGNIEKIVNAIIYQTALVLEREYIYMEREKIKLAMESEHLKSTLLRSISHDIRTPLTGIQGATNVLGDMLGKTEFDQTIKQDALHLISNITEETSWLIMTIQNILNMTRISDGRLEIKADFESVDDLLEQMSNRIPAFYDRTRLNVQMPGEIYLVRVDGNLFVQVLLNLLDNAYKHAGNDAHIEVSVSVEGEKLVFQVKDDGIGIDATVLPQIFEGFVTCSTHAADKGRGVGLGLAICKAIVEAQEGTITAFNNPEGGACFQIKMAYEQ